jgi:hypothetical protein
MNEDFSMPEEVKSVVQKMIQAGESEEAIASVIKRYGTPSGSIKSPYEGYGVLQNPPTKQAEIPMRKLPNEPSSWGEGVLNSLRPGGEASQAADKGALGFVKGATVDLFPSLWGMAKTVGNLYRDPTGTTAEIGRGLRDLPGQVSEKFQQAGSDPEGWGRLMGQTTGQPLVTEGLVRGAPGAISAASKIPVRNIVRGASPYVEQAGNLMMAAPLLRGTGLDFPTVGAGYALRRIGKAMGKIEPTPIAPVSDIDALREFWGGEKPPQIPPTGKVTVNPSSTPDPFSRTSIRDPTAPEMTDTDALRQFWGGDKPPNLPLSQDVTVNSPSQSDPFSRTPLDKQVVKTSKPPVVGKVVGKAPTLEESLIDALKPEVEGPSQVDLPPQPGSEMTPSPGTYRPDEGGSGYQTGNPSTTGPNPPEPVIQHSPSRPGTLRGSLDGGKTWKYSTDNGETWSSVEPK